MITLTGGFCAGDTLTFNASIDNKSSRPIVYVTFTLVKKLTFYASGKSQTLTFEIASFKYSSKIEPRTCQKWTNNAVNIPDNCKATNNLSKIIKTNYEFLLNFGAGGFTTSTDCAIPIVIGTVPFKQMDNDSARMAFNDGPPSYEEALNHKYTPTPSAPYKNY